MSAASMKNISLNGARSVPVADGITITITYTAVEVGKAAYDWGTVKTYDENYEEGNYSGYVGDPDNTVLPYEVEVVDPSAAPSEPESSEEPVVTYTVTFKGFDGAVIGTDTVNAGEAATAPAAPAVEGYDFTGWDADISAVNADITVNAVYTKKSYEVKFVVNGEVVKTESVKYQEAATAPSVTAPAGKTFKGWDVTFDSITADTTVTAVFDVITYTVTFMVDGVVVGTDTTVYGGTVTAPAFDIPESKNFKGWDASLENVTADYTVNAILETKTFTVTFIGWNGEVLKTQTGVEYGTAATAPETVSAPAGNEFKTWDIDFSNVTSDLTVKATFEGLSYTVTFMADGAVVDTQTVNYGAAAIAPEAPAKEGYTFARWDVDYTNITGDLTVNAVYEINKYTVTFVVPAQGTTTDTLVFNDIAWGTAWADAVTVPTVTATSAVYAFDKWDIEFPATITSDLTITAQFVSTGAGVTVTFEVEGTNGIIMGTNDAGEVVMGGYSINVASGAAAGSTFVAPEAIANENYHFVGWFVDGAEYDFNTVLDGDITLVAKFALNAITINDDGFWMGEGSGDNSQGMVNAGLYVTLNDGTVPTGLWMVVFYQDAQGKTNVATNELSVVDDGTGNYYIPMGIVPNMWASFDVYLTEGLIDFSANDWNVVDIAKDIIPQ